MSRHQEIVFALSGQTFVFDPPERYRPSGTPTVQVFKTGEDDDGDTVSATTGSCSVDSVNTTLSSSASAGSASLSVTSATGIARDRRYLLTDTDGDAEWVEVRAITGTTVTLRHPLVNDYGSGSTFQGCRISISVDSTWVNNESNLTDVLYLDLENNRTEAPGASGYRLRWAYTVNSVATIGVSYADLVRYQAKNLVSALDVDRLFPGWIDRLGPDYRADQGAALVDEAFHAVRMDALTDAQLLRRIRDTQVLAELVKYRANLLAVQNHVFHNGVDQRSLDIARDLYDQRYNALIREPKVAVDQSGGGSNGEAIRLPAWRR